MIKIIGYWLWEYYSVGLMYFLKNVNSIVVKFVLRRIEEMCLFFWLLFFMLFLMVSIFVIIFNIIVYCCVLLWGYEF